MDVDSDGVRVTDDCCVVCVEDKASINNIGKSALAFGAGQPVCVLDESVHHKVEEIWGDRAALSDSLVLLVNVGGAVRIEDSE